MIEFISASFDKNKKSWKRDKNFLTRFIFLNSLNLQKISPRLSGYKPLNLWLLIYSLFLRPMAASYQDGIFSEYEILNKMLLHSTVHSINSEKEIWN